MELKHSEDKVEELLGTNPEDLDPELTIPANEPTIEQGFEPTQESAQVPEKEEKPIPPGVKGGYLRQMLNDSDRF